MFPTTKTHLSQVIKNECSNSLFYVGCFGNSNLSDLNFAHAEEVVAEVIAPKPAELPSPLVIEDIKDSPSQRRRSRDLEEPVDRIMIDRDISTINLTTVEAAYSSPVEETPIVKAPAAPSQAVRPSTSRQSFMENSVVENIPGMIVLMLEIC